MNSTRHSRRPLATDERGIALAMAVFALVVIGALVAGTFFAGRLEQRTGLNSMFAEQSFELAEAGATEVLANWAPATFNGLPPGSRPISSSFGRTASVLTRTARSWRSARLGCWLVWRSRW
jgi:hypothetical protein